MVLFNWFFDSIILSFSILFCGGLALLAFTGKAFLLRLIIKTGRAINYTVKACGVTHGY